MLVALVLDKPLATAKALVDDAPALVEEIMRIMKNKQSHPVIAQMVKPDVRDDLPISAEGKQPSKTSRPTWVSVQDVVLNKPKDRPRNQVNRSQSSATFTTHKQQREMSLLMSLWFLLTCHSLTQNRCGVAC